MKKNLFYLSLFFLIPFFTANAQISNKLDGNIIRYHSNRTSSKNVFDGNPTTYMEAYIASGSWVGLDLGSPHVITGIEFTSGSRNMLTGIFEGANDPDFKDAVPLQLIDFKTDNLVNYSLDVSVSKGFRYVRYFGAHNSYCRINELKFYGYQGEGDDSKFHQITNLPTIVINTTSMSDISTKKDVVTKDYYEGNILAINKDGSSSYSNSLRIRGRGNSSWNAEKKGFKIKLDTKTKLLDGVADAREWTLIAVHADKSLVRSMLGFDISRKIGFEYTPHAQYVDLVINGDYRGTYLLCDQLEVRKNRVDINKMDPTDVTSPNIEGGYLIEIDAYAYSSNRAKEEVEDDSKSIFSRFSSSYRKIPVSIKYPDKDDIVLAQKKYIKSVFDSFEFALFGANYKDPVLGYRNYLDVNSFSNYFLLEELVGNPDAFWSTYMVKKRGDNLLYTGPIWDLDLSMDNDSRVSPISAIRDYLSLTKASAAGNPNQVAGYFASGSGNGNNMKGILNRLLSDPFFKDNLHDLWKNIRESKGINREYLLAKVNELKQEVNESRKLNFHRWSNGATPLGSYDAEVNRVLDYTYERLAWMDNKLGYKSDNTNNDFIYQPISVLGFNSDIVADNMPINSNITRAMSADMFVTYTSAVKQIGAMPADGIFESIKSNAIYKMAPYNGLQTLFVRPSTTEKLTLVEKTSTKGFSFLGASANGDAVLDVTVNYTDGSKEQNRMTVHDWWTGYPQAAVINLGQVQAYNAGNGVHYNFRLFEYPIMTDESKVVESFTLRNTRTTGRGFIFAVSKIVEDQPSVRSANIEYESDSELINVWPNPATRGDKVYVKTNGVERIKLYNISGVLLKDQINEAGDSLIQLGINNLPSGLYVLQINFKDGNKESRSLIVK